MRVLIWYRHDLRLHDHEAIYQAVQEQLEIIPFYCFDERQFGLTSYGFPKTGKFRAKFLLESVANLRQSLEGLGGNLIIRRGKPEEIIPQLVQELQIARVYYHQEVTAEELAVEKAVNKALSMVPRQIKTFWTATLYHPDDLPFTLNQLPELFTNFRKQVERHWQIRATYPSPKNLTKLPNIDLGNLPSLNDLGLTEPILDWGGVLSFQGGEMVGKSRVKEYIWDSDSLKTYKETRNEMWLFGNCYANN